MGGKAAKASRVTTVVAGRHRLVPVPVPGQSMGKPWTGRHVALLNTLDSLNFFVRCDVGTRQETRTDANPPSGL